MSRACSSLAAGAGSILLALRAAWDGAVDYYQKVVSPHGFGARQQFPLRMQLAGFDAEWRQDERAIEYVEIARSLRSVAAPAYLACRWSAQDGQNQKWIEELIRWSAPGVRTSTAGALSTKPRGR